MGDGANCWRTGAIVSPPARRAHFIDESVYVIEPYLVAWICLVARGLVTWQRQNNNSNRNNRKSNKWLRTTSLRQSFLSRNITEIVCAKWSRRERTPQAARSSLLFTLQWPSNKNPPLFFAQVHILETPIVDYLHPSDGRLRRRGRDSQRRLVIHEISWHIAYSHCSSLASNESGSDHLVSVVYLSSSVKRWQTMFLSSVQLMKKDQNFHLKNVNINKVLVGVSLESHAWREWVQ